MASETEYLEKIKKLGIDGMELSASNQKEAKSSIATIRLIQSELRQIKKSVNLEIKTMRAVYSERIEKAGSVTGGLFSLFGKRGAGGRIRAAAKRDETKARNAAIAPYEKIKLYIDTLIHKLDDAKHQFTSYIVKSKEAEPEKINTVADYCPSCGKKTVKFHRFCPACGSLLQE